MSSLAKADNRMPSAIRSLKSGGIQKIPSSGIVLLYSEGREGRLICTIATFWWGFRMTARCALYYKMCHFLVQRHLGKGDRCRSPVASLSGARGFKYCAAKFSGKRYCGASSASSLHAPWNVWPFHYHSGERSCSTRNPHDRGKILSPSGHPSPIPLRPILCSLDTHQGSLRAPLWNHSTKGHIRCPYVTAHRLFRHGFGPKFDLGNPISMLSEYG
jgi:hypothetical protein